MAMAISEIYATIMTIFEVSPLLAVFALRELNVKLFFRVGK